MTPRMPEIETTAALEIFLIRAADAGRRPRAVVQSVDVEPVSDLLITTDVSELVFLGCDMSGETKSEVVRGGALVFPEIPDVPFDAYRGELYSPAELLGSAPHYSHTVDAKVYAWSRSRQAKTATGALARALHDHSILTALDETLASVPRRNVVGVMGGHALVRGTTDYRAAALLGRSLARSGRTVLTGGGPGAMEAANLGAYLAPASNDALDAAIELLATAPTFHPNIDAWAAVALEVLDRWPNPKAASFGIPTWFYGHEPPNPFAQGIAKFFANPQREATLLERCGGGILFLPGAAGTVQEIFTDACENYYAMPGQVAPMVLVGIEQWTKRLPAWQLLTSLAGERELAGFIHLVDTVDEALDVLTASAN